MNMFERFFDVTKALFSKGYYMPRKLIERQFDARFCWRLEGLFSEKGMDLVQTGYDIEECLYRDFHETNV